MDAVNTRGLSKETVENSLVVLRRLQDKQAGACLAEIYAVSQLIDWLAGVQLSPSDSDGEDLDESTRSYLASYKDTFGRKSASQRGHGELLGPSAKAQRLQPVLPGDPELHHELNKLGDWNDFNIFAVDRLSEGRPLQAVGLAIFDRFDLMTKLRLPLPRLQSYLQAVEEAYNANPYHNSMHAADVTQSLGVMFLSESFTSQLTSLELLTMLLSALVHDVGHPGVTNEFLINTSAESAVVYNDNSINENMHASMAWQLLQQTQNNFLDHLPEEEQRFVRRTLIQIILATDMAGHSALLKEFSANMRLMGEQNFSSWPQEARASALHMCVHCADISNPARPPRFGRLWAERITAEFFAQGDQERQRGMPVSPLCDRERVQVPKSQLTFLDYVVRPSFEALKGLCPNVAATALQNMELARSYWEAACDPPPTPAHAE